MPVLWTERRWEGRTRGRHSVQPTAIEIRSGGGRPPVRPIRNGSRHSLQRVPTHRDGSPQDAAICAEKTCFWRDIPFWLRLKNTWDCPGLLKGGVADLEPLGSGVEFVVHAR